MDACCTQSRGKVKLWFHGTLHLRCPSSGWQFQQSGALRLCLHMFSSAFVDGWRSRCAHYTLIKIGTESAGAWPRHQRTAWILARTRSRATAVRPRLIWMGSQTHSGATGRRVTGRDPAPAAMSCSRRQEHGPAKARRHRALRRAVHSGMYSRRMRALMTRGPSRNGSGAARGAVLNQPTRIPFEVTKRTTSEGSDLRRR